MNCRDTDCHVYRTTTTSNEETFASNSQVIYSEFLENITCTVSGMFGMFKS